MTGELYHLYYEEMVHWAVSMTKNLSSAEDLVQETFLRAMKNEQLFKGVEFYLDAGPGFTVQQGICMWIG